MVLLLILQIDTSSSIARPKLSARKPSRASLVAGKILTEIKTLRRSFGYGFFPRLGRPVARFLIAFGLDSFTADVIVDSVDTIDPDWPIASSMLANLAYAYT